MYLMMHDKSSETIDSAADDILGQELNFTFGLKHVPVEGIITTTQLVSPYLVVSRGHLYSLIWKIYLLSVARKHGENICVFLFVFLSGDFTIDIPVNVLVLQIAFSNPMCRAHCNSGFCTCLELFCQAHRPMHHWLSLRHP